LIEAHRRSLRVHSVPQFVVFHAASGVHGVSIPQTPASVPYAVGDSIKVNLHNGKVVDATIRAIIDGGEKLQVDFGKDETALVQKWQIIG
jgi:hypothetical protein